MTQRNERIDIRICRMIILPLGQLCARFGCGDDAAYCNAADFAALGDDADATPRSFFEMAADFASYSRAPRYTAVASGMGDFAADDRC